MTGGSTVQRLATPEPQAHISPELAAHLAQIRARKVVMNVARLTKQFGDGPERVLALSDINFEVHHREFVSVIGPSGCGKSTLIRILAGLDYPTSGQVFVDGLEVLGPGADRGMVFQSYTLFPWLTVLKNVMFGPRMKGTPELRSREKAHEWLRLVGLEDFADAYPSQLSGGMKQRVAIARALANQPRILLMDEPFGALDAQTRASMQGHLLKIFSQINVTILFITHDLDEAIYLSDKIVVLGARPGRILDVLEVPVQHPRTVEQMQSPPFLATKMRLEQLIYQREIAQKQDVEMIHSEGSEAES